MEMKFQFFEQSDKLSRVNTHWYNLILLENQAKLDWIFTARFVTKISLPLGRDLFRTIFNNFYNNFNPPSASRTLKIK